MPPKAKASVGKGKGGSTATSTKSVSKSGDAHVVTVATGDKATAGAPIEERELTFEPKPVGILDLDGNSITKLGKSSQAEKAGIALTKKGKPWVWKVLEVNGTAVSTKKECLGEMKKCKEAGKKYKIKFQTGPASAFAAATASSETAEDAAAAAVPSAGGAGGAAAEVPAEDASAGAAAEPATGAADGAAPTEEELAAAAAEEAKRAEEAAAAAAEVERLKSVANGECTFIYEMYDEKFPIENNSTTAAAIDDVYCLSFVMANCKIHLSKQTTYVHVRIKVPNERRLKLMDMDPSDEEWMDPFVPEEPEGTFLKLEKDLTYYVYIVQDAAQEEKDRKAMAGKLETLKAAAAGLDEKARTTEGCSCQYGNPCIDPYICLDWDNRFAVATANAKCEGGVWKQKMVRKDDVAGADRPNYDKSTGGVKDYTKEIGK